VDTGFSRKTITSLIVSLMLCLLSTFTNTELISDVISYKQFQTAAGHSGKEEMWPFAIVNNKQFFSLQIFMIQKWMIPIFNGIVVVYRYIFGKIFIKI